MEVQPTSPATSATAAAAAAAPKETAFTKAASDFDTFLALLTAQLRNQDPTQPADSTELVAQLAAFSSVEQQIQTNNKLDGLLSAFAATGHSSLVGKWIEGPGGEVSGTVVAIRYASGKVTAEIAGGGSVDLSQDHTVRDAAPAGGA